MHSTELLNCHWSRLCSLLVPQENNPPNPRTLTPPPNFVLHLCELNSLHFEQILCTNINIDIIDHMVALCLSIDAGLRPFCDIVPQKVICVSRMQLSTLLVLLVAPAVVAFTTVGNVRSASSSLMMSR